MTTLGGTLVMANAKKFDYCGVEAVTCLLDFCDEVSVVTFSHEDTELLSSLMENPKLRVTQFEMSDWRDKVKGSGRIAYWQNVAKSYLKTDWQFSSQADEIIHEKSFPAIREAINSGMGDSFLSWRLNLWGSPYTYLHVAPHRKPCSDIVIRLARIKFDSYGDGESLAVVPPVGANFVQDIRIYHCGFIRDRRVMNDKIIEMQTKVFDMGDYDQLCKDDEKNNNGIFNPWSRFSKNDVAPIPDELPIYIQSWAKERTYEG